MANKTNEQHVRDINRTAPAIRDAQLGQVVHDLIVGYTALLADFTALRTRYNAVLAKLDADGGVTDTNYAALQAAPAITATAVAPLSAR
jgi:allophanate hydrolase subunit 1